MCTLERLIASSLAKKTRARILRLGLLLIINDGSGPTSAGRAATTMNY